MNRQIARRLRLIVIGLLVVLVVAYAGVSLIAYQVATSPPGRISPDTPTPPFEDVRFPTRGGSYSVAAYYLAPSVAATDALIIVHGLGSSRHDSYHLRLAEALRGLGYAVLSIDLGGGAGDTGGAGKVGYGYYERWDVLGGYDYLLTRHFAPRHIGLVGESLGGATSLLAAAQESGIAAVWSDSAYARADSAVSEQLAANGIPPILVLGGEVWGFVLGGPHLWEVTPIVLGATFAANGQVVYLVHDENDRRIAIHHGVDLNAAYTSAGVDVSFWRVPALDHVQAFEAHPDEYLARLDAFFRAHFHTSF